MRLGLICCVLGALSVGGCIRSVEIPQQEAALKDACHGKDRPMAGVASYSLWRCGEGDKAKYAIYKQGALVSEVNELQASQAAGGFSCIARGLKPNTPEFAACEQQIGSVALNTTSNLRNQENAEAAARRQQIADGLAAAGAAMQASAAAQAASQPQTVRVQTNCTTSRLGNYLNTNCY